MIFSLIEVNAYTRERVNASTQNKKANRRRTATTAYPCYLPVLGDSAGAGRIRLARTANLQKKSGSGKILSKEDA